VVHHGGAGTTAAAARAGRPQLVVHHAFDQVATGRQVAQAGLGPPPLARLGLTPERLAEALGPLVQQEAYAQRAAALGEVIRGRDPIQSLLGLLDRLAQR
jgi:UDP:flavonoid glycosyltransferase YjiC (YdhE family)